MILKIQTSAATLITGPALDRDRKYDPIKDFASISLAGTTAYMLVAHPSVAAKSVRDLIALAKASPARLAFAVSASAQDDHKQILVLHATRRDSQMSTISETELPRVLDAGLGRAEHRRQSRERAAFYLSWLLSLQHQGIPLVNPPHAGSVQLDWQLLTAFTAAAIAAERLSTRQRRVARSIGVLLVVHGRRCCRIERTRCSQSRV